MDTTSSSSIETNETMAGLLRIIDNFDETSICSSKDFYVRNVLRTAAEASLRAYLHACASPGEQLVLEGWTLCGPGEIYMCDDIFNYTNT
ncbi:hypothetical protein DPMN_120500 [Dreissena polymorpha]|uniref:Uncharacterized protein n=1 Tax=Dreissena polymorpha TaxID=45954 RepID=A0A9D4GNN3_DREPO|nr:hypothetical protein DPMN_120500 [Dreissena polymorpha]